MLFENILSTHCGVMMPNAPRIIIIVTIFTSRGRGNTVGAPSDGCLNASEAKDVDPDLTVSHASRVDPDQTVSQ